MFPTSIILMDWRCLSPQHTHRIKKAGIACPEVVILKKHILVMSFIGHNQVPAPKLKDATLTSEDLKKAYEQVLQVCSHFNRNTCTHAHLYCYPISTMHEIIQIQVKSFRWRSHQISVFLSPRPGRFCQMGRYFRNYWALLYTQHSLVCTEFIQFTNWDISQHYCMSKKFFFLN